MKVFCSTLLLLLISMVYSQSTNEIKLALKNVNTIEKAKLFDDLSASWSKEIIEYNFYDTDIPNYLKKLKIDEIKIRKEDNKEFIYKLIDESNQKEFRVSYIYLDGSQLNKSKIDSIRVLIRTKFDSGIPFTDLVDEYNMDFNSKKGDLGWFREDIMVKEFEEAIKSHKKNDIFNVDVESRNWYYVVLKTHQDRNNLKKLFLKVEVKE